MIQDHVFNPEIPVSQRVNPPVRVILGRKPLWFNKERAKLQQHFADLKEDIAAKKQAAVENFVGNQAIQSGFEFIKNLTNVNVEQDNSIDSSAESSEPNVDYKPEATQLITAFVSPADREEEKRAKDNKLNEDAVLEETFSSIKKAYQSNLKYVTGWGQTQDSNLMLK